jgi:hypothetical protein
VLSRPASTPRDPPRLLNEAGLAASEAETGMWLDLRTTPSQPHVADLEIPPVAALHAAYAAGYRHDQHPVGQGNKHSHRSGPW